MALQFMNLVSCLSSSTPYKYYSRFISDVQFHSFIRSPSRFLMMSSSSKVLESLQQKFPDVPKSQLGNKVREISDYSFLKNHWKVKKDILIRLGLPVSPDRITSFFSKRCLAPDGKNFNPNETSPLSLKSGSAVQDQQGCTYNDQ